MESAAPPPLPALRNVSALSSRGLVSPGMARITQNSPQETDPVPPASPTSSIHENSPQETDPVPPASPASSIHEICEHDLVSSVVPSFDKCARCGGPYAAIKWTGIRCKHDMNLSDSEQSEDSEFDEQQPLIHSHTSVGMKRASQYEQECPGTSGMKRDRQPVEEPPGTSDGMKRDKQPAEEPPSTSDDIDSAIESTSTVSLDAKGNNARRSVLSTLSCWDEEAQVACWHVRWYDP
ncbi:uncharacterized protein LOC114433497 isoform X3 [Parambassis ranga]|uniref:Uncharacterized protein LOC114433497 isoform X3 n=1 Tax=Parambassis ranga TaxID=210632 RepID=A0A6P7HQD9_9TELE|nr:uncharacterized protein LOC114433497 isoform X3 [Parambassis ranga]XP_028257896.1 uncharacterized protein LOC114433497 isoform X3 [Parambassis ranga]